MNKKNTEKLFKDFPKLYRERSNIISPLKHGFECGNGWYNLIYELSEKLSKLNPDCMVVQVKEKFGGLRFYVNDITEDGYKLISEYETKSYHTCEACGDTKTAKQRRGNWIKTLCFKCHIKRKINRFILDIIWEIKYKIITLKRKFKKENNLKKYNKEEIKF